MMLDATQNNQTELTAERLFSWHASLFPYGNSFDKNMRIAKYRDKAMQVISGAFGRERIHYQAPDAEKVEQEMNKFLNWINKDNNSSLLIKSAIAHFWFVSIHPFDDGNGRIARAIADMLLAQADKNKQRFYSITTQISKDKKEYYRILEQTQRSNGDITDWLIWYLSCLENAIIDAETILSQVLNKAIFWQTFSQTGISQRQRNILNIYLDGYDAKLTIKNWAKLSETSIDTANRDIKDLIAKKVLSPNKGKVRDISYTIHYILVDEFSQNFSNIKIEQLNDSYFVSAIFRNTKQVKEKLLAIDHYRLKQQETTEQQLLYKYFAYLLE